MTGADFLDIALDVLAVMLGVSGVAFICLAFACWWADRSES